MRFPLLRALILASLALAACQASQPSVEPSPAVSPTPAMASRPPAWTSLTSGQQAYRHVLALAQDTGSRPAGTDAEREAAQYVAQQLTAYGYQTDVQEFSFEYYVAQTATLEMVAPEPRSLDARALHLSGTGDVTAELAAAGIGRPEDFPPEGLGGRIALIERGELTFSEKVANAAAAGAAAVVTYNNQPGIFRGSLQAESTIPAASLSQAEGRLLLSLLKEGPVTLRLSVGGGPEVGQSQNIIGHPAENDCQVAVGAHYDSVAEGPGANDNGSGVAVLLETARVLNITGEDEGVCFLAFGAEEAGLFGSRHFLASLALEETTGLKEFINLDMVGVGEEWHLIGSEDLVEMADREAPAFGLDPVPAELPPAMTSDHVNFLHAGIPTIMIYRSGDPHYHTESDRAEFVDPQLLEEAADLAILIVRGLENP